MKILKLLVISFFILNLPLITQAKTNKEQTRRSKEWCSKGIKALDKKNYYSAIKNFSRAIELNSEYALAYFSRGTAYGQLEKFKKSISDLTKVIELKIEFVNEAYCSRGSAYKMLGKKREAVNDFNEYLRIRGNKDGKAAEVRKWIFDLGYKPKY